MNCSSNSWVKAEEGKWWGQKDLRFHGTLRAHLLKLILSTSTLHVCATIERESSTLKDFSLYLFLSILFAPLILLTQVAQILAKCVRTYVWFCQELGSLACNALCQDKSSVMLSFELIFGLDSIGAATKIYFSVLGLSYFSKNRENLCILI